MRVALFTGGQPRFTECFSMLMKQLKGFESADVYIGLWASDWATDETDARLKIEKILEPKYKLAKVLIKDQPFFELPPHKLNHPPAQPENIRWWFERRMAMWSSLKMTFNLIPNQYDIIIRFRLDGYLSRDLDLNEIDFSKTNLIYPNWPGAGWPWAWLNDQFAIGNYDGMKFYVELANKFPEFVVKSDPNWEHNGHGTWSSEHILGMYMRDHNVPLTTINLSSHLAGAHKSAVRGRSRYTDKHYHLPVIKDPTER